MPGPEYRLRVGIEKNHGTLVHPDGSETRYLATRALPDSGGDDLLQIDESLADNLAWYHRQALTIGTLRAIGWRCASVAEGVRDMPKDDVDVLAQLARAAGALVATGEPFLGTANERWIPAAKLVDLHQRAGKIAAVHAMGGRNVVRFGSQLLVPVNPEALGHISQAQFVRR
jgi:hypothetical protein